jgi:DNA-binding CsgD family transcriptional regulator
VSDDTRQRTRERIRTLAGSGLDLVAFWQQCAELLASEVPHHLSPCWYSLDPASLLVTSHFQVGLPTIPGEWLAQEYYADDVHKLVDVARSARGISTLHEVTGGDPTRSQRWHDNMAYGGDQELIAALRTRSGEVWGALGLYRAPGEPMFSDEDIAFLRGLAPLLAEGARRSLLFGEAADPQGPDAPGLLILDDDWSMASSTEQAARWLADLPDGDLDAGQLPSVVYAVAGQALNSAPSTEGRGEAGVARVLTRAGRWVVLHGAVLQADGRRQAAVIIEPAHPVRIAPLLIAAYGLTRREEQITRLVLRGRSTAEIATDLAISPHTLQEHLKHIFDKTGVRSRRDLAGKVFFNHYEPRVRDNEHRAERDLPFRGGPAPHLAHPRRPPPHDPPS